MEKVSTFEINGFEVSLVNAISPHGYVRVTKTTPREIDDYVDQYLLANKIGVILKDLVEAEAISYHSLKGRSFAPDYIAIIPRYTGDYPDANITYDISESDVQKQTGDSNEMKSTAEKLKELLLTSV